MNYDTTVKYWSKVWKNLLDYVDDFNWGYIGAGLFLFLFLLFLYDTLSSSQMSLKFLALIAILMALCMYLGLQVSGGFAGPQLNN